MATPHAGRLPVTAAGRVSSPRRCEKLLSTGASCARPAVYQVNGALSCVRHLVQMIGLKSSANGQGHVWATVQILGKEKRDV